MTMIKPNKGQSETKSAASIQWTVVQPGLWVGKSAGEFAGMIERRDDGFAAIRFTNVLGVFVTVSEAKASFSS